MSDIFSRIEASGVDFADQADDALGWDDELSIDSGEEDRHSESASEDGDDQGGVPL